MLFVPSCVRDTTCLACLVLACFLASCTAITDGPLKCTIRGTTLSITLTNVDLTTTNLNTTLWPCLSEHDPMVIKHVSQVRIYHAKEVEPDALAVLPKLGFTGITNLELSDCHFGTLQSNTFAALSNLTALDLRFNPRFRKLESGAFKGLDLHQVYMRDNPSLVTLPSDLFTAMKRPYSVYWIGLSNCGIISLQTGTFVGLTKLRFLDLSGNNIEYIGSKTFDAKSLLLRNQDPVVSTLLPDDLSGTSRLWHVPNPVDLYQRFMVLGDYFPYQNHHYENASWPQGLEKHVSTAPVPSGLFMTKQLSTTSFSSVCWISNDIEETVKWKNTTPVHIGIVPHDLVVNLGAFSSKTDCYQRCQATRSQHPWAKKCVYTCLGCYLQGRVMYPVSPTKSSDQEQHFCEAVSADLPVEPAVGAHICAEEGGSCACPGGTVFYGQKWILLNSKTWAITTLQQLKATKYSSNHGFPPTNVTTCNTQSFHGDPSLGNLKHCYCVPAQGAPASLSVKCDCASNRASKQYPLPVLHGGDEGYCGCPAGFHSRKNLDESRMCELCPRGTYSGRNSEECTSCNGDSNDVEWYTTSEDGSKSSADCELISEAYLYIAIGACAVALCMVLLVVGGFVYHTRLRSRRMEDELKALREKALTDTVFDQGEEIKFLRTWFIKKEEIEFKKKIAAGAEGEVWLGSYVKCDKPVAIKKAFGLCEEGTPVWKENEIAFLILMRHPRLVEFLGAGSVIHPELGPQAFIVQEFMTGGSLDSRLWEHPESSVTDKERLTWAMDIAEGMDFIHQGGYSHRDLKSANVLHDFSTGRAKVADFGMVTLDKPGWGSNRMGRWFDDKLTDETNNPDNALVHTASRGTCQWMAPELCEVETQIQKMMSDKESTMETKRQFLSTHEYIEYDRKVDVYAFGVLLYEIASHRVPWGALPPREIFGKVAKGERPSLAGLPEEKILPGWLELMQQCWAHDASCRPEFGVILAKLRVMEDLLEVKTKARVPWTSVMRISFQESPKAPVVVENPSVHTELTVLSV